MKENLKKIVIFYIIINKLKIWKMRFGKLKTNFYNNKFKIL